MEIFGEIAKLCQCCADCVKVGEDLKKPYAIHL